MTVLMKNEVTLQMYAARGTRKRGPLTTKNPTDEERAKIVKSKKIRLLAPAKSRKIEKHKCAVCGIGFTRLDYLERHNVTIHASKSASDAKTAIGKPSKVRRSARTKAKCETSTKNNKENVEKPSSSNISTSSEKTLEQISSIDCVDLKANARCLVCNEKLSNDDFESHICLSSNQILETMAVEILSCAHCEYTCKRKDTLKNHVLKVHMGVKTNWKRRAMMSCAVCQKTFVQKANLRRHVLSQHFVSARSKKRSWKKGYCCDICRQGFHDQRDVLAHRSIVHEDASPMSWTSFCSSLAELKRCQDCDRYFRDDEYFGRHNCTQPELTEDKLSRVVDSKPSYKCDLCSSCFHWKWMYRSHREGVHPQAEPLEWDTLVADVIDDCCLICFKTFSDCDNLELHKPECETNKNTTNMFVCELCGCNYARKWDLKRHKRLRHSDSKEDVSDSDGFPARKKCCIQCPYCNLTRATRSGILAHIKEVHDIETDTPFVCVPCNKVFKRKATMDTHNQVYHPKEENAEEASKILKEAEILLNGETAYHCGICNRNILNSLRFLAHYRLHYVERKFTCDLCGKQTRTQHQLNTHIKIIHLNIRNYECDICGKTFHARQSCEEHRRIHTGERPFSCEICGKTFVAMNALFTHKKFHNDFYAHPCSMCPKKFKVRRSLINHIRTHTGERPYKCELCPKTFNNSSRFSYHKKVTHSDNRPFTCTQCGSCFKANKFLMRHMKLHNIRTHIQFRRRNNPAYFAEHGTNSSKTGEQKETDQSQGINGLQSSDVPTIYSIQQVYGDVANIELDRSGENSNVASVDENLVDEAKNHFLTEAFGNSGQLAFATSSEDTSGRNDNKHIMCL